MTIQQWHATTTTRHGYTLTYQFLADLQMFVYRPRVASRYSVRTSAILNNSPASYDNNCVCHECIYMLEVSMATQTFLDVLRASGQTPVSKFLNLPLIPGIHGHPAGFLIP